MAKIPFDEDVMTLIMGVGDPEKPGQHGRTEIKAPEKKALDLITEIRDLCEEYIRTAGKEEEGPERDEEEPKQPMKPEEEGE